VIRPRRLRPGDRIALVAPASGFKAADLDAGATELRRLGFEPAHSPDVFARQWFEAGPPEHRARMLHDAWCDPSIAAIVTIRGGYGSQQLLPLLQPAVMRQARKMLIGYSDITTLLCWSLMHGVVSLHGPMVEGRLSAGPTAYDEQTFLRAVTEAEPLGLLPATDLEVFVQGEASGTVVGGTLTQLTTLLGTPWALALPPGAILLLEDVSERPYRIHRMLTHLAQSGTLARAGALVFGEFRGCDEPGGPPAIRDVLREFTRGFPGPVLFGLPFGHVTGRSLSIPIGVRGRVTTAPAGLTIEEAAVE
jgi:muramoyltetrapeptide carboxypeptidase